MREGAGKAGCRLHPWAPCNKKHGGRTTGEPEQRRLSLRNGFNGCSALSPESGLVSLRRLAGLPPARLDTSVGVSGPHGFAVRLGPRLLLPKASIASRTPRP